MNKDTGCYDMSKSLVLGFEGILPDVAEDVFIAPGAVVIGCVSIAPNVTIWYNAVVRGDANHITIGEFTNIQDNSTVHTTVCESTSIGRYVTVGHGCVLDGCKIQDYCLIGMRAAVLDGAEIGEGSIVGAGAVVTPGTKIPPFSVVVGMPGKVIKILEKESVEARIRQALHYHKLGRRHQNRP